MLIPAGQKGRVGMALGAKVVTCLKLGRQLAAAGGRMQMPAP
jgi:hypothetical protein